MFPLLKSFKLNDSINLEGILLGSIWKLDELSLFKIYLLYFFSLQFLQLNS